MLATLASFWRRPVSESGHEHTADACVPVKPASTGAKRNAEGRSTRMRTEWYILSIGHGFLSLRRCVLFGYSADIMDMHSADTQGSIFHGYKNYTKL